MTSLSERAWHRLGPAILCYLDHDFGGMALVTTASTEPVAEELADYFSQVHVFREEPQSAIATSLLTGPWPEHTFDCVADRGILTRRDLTAGEVAIRLDAVRRLLKPGAWLVCTDLNRSYIRHRIVGCGTSPAAFARLLRTVGFNEVRRAFITPTLEWPVTLVPDSADAVKAYETYDAISGSHSWVRRLLAAVGMRSLLYPGYLIAART